MKPGVAKYYNLLILGVGYLGKVEDFKEPDVKSMKADTPLGYKVDIGFPEAMEAEVSLNSVNTNILDALLLGDEAKFELKEIVIEDGKEIAITHTMIGSFDKEGDTTKIKETKKGKLKIYPIQYTQEKEGKEVVFIDMSVPIFRINGKDKLEDTRAKLN